MSNLAIRFLNEEGNPVTEETVIQLAQQIRKGYSGSVWLALDEYGEEEFLAVYMENGWVSLSYNYWDIEGESHMALPVNPQCPYSREDAPVFIGGQTPVAKRNALNNLDLAAECVLHFAKTGRLYPQLQWEEALEPEYEDKPTNEDVPPQQITLVGLSTAEQLAQGGGKVNPTRPVEDPVELPTALTDGAYALKRAAEVEPLAPEAVKKMKSHRFEEAASLFTAAIREHPEQAALYILRSHCWNRLEGTGSGISHKPDMDRDMTKVLELEPDNILALRARCPTTGTKKRLQRHIEDLTKLIALDPEHQDKYLVSRAYRYSWLGEGKAAKADLQTVLNRGILWDVDLIYLCREYAFPGF